jgi:hypothetical protein
MGDVDISRSGPAVFEARDGKNFDDRFSADMVFAGPVPKPIGKQAFVSLQSALIAAMMPAHWPLVSRLPIWPPPGPNGSGGGLCIQLSWRGAS